MRNHMYFLAGVTCFLSSFICVLSVYRWFQKDVFAILAGVYITGLLLGIVHGSIYPQKIWKPVFVGALAAIMGLWSPIVIGTYGFAIMALPLLFIYAICAASGAHIATKVKGGLRSRSLSAGAKQSDLNNSNLRIGRNVGGSPKQSAGSIILVFLAGFAVWFLSLLYIAADSTSDGSLSAFVLVAYPVIGPAAFHIPAFLAGSCAGISIFLVNEIFRTRIR
jgi:hypothetical protein